MALSKSIQELIEDGLARTDRDNEPALESDQILPWAIQEARKLWAFIARINPDELTKVSAAWTIPSGNTKTVAAMSVTDYLSPRGVDYSADGGTTFVPLKTFNFSDRGVGSGALSYRRRGTTFEILPASQAPLYTYRLWYIHMPVIEGPATVLDLPIGGDEYIAEGIAARIRVRFEEDPMSHQTQQAVALDVVRRFLSSHGQGQSDVVKEANADDDGWVSW